MDRPEGSRLHGMVAKLKRSIYRWKQCLREWYYRFVEYRGPFEFDITATDPCVVVCECGNLFLVIYVDDIPLLGATGKLKDQTIYMLKTEFNVNHMSELNRFLGNQITFTEVGITLSQTSFIDKILNRFLKQDCNPVLTLISSNHEFQAIEENEQHSDTTAYQQMI